MKRAILALLLAILAFPACAQAPVKQSGNVTPNQVPWWVTSGVIGGGVSSADSPVTSFGVTNNGGCGLSVASDRITAAGRNLLCFGASTNGPAVISLQNYGTATPQLLEFIINGATYQFPFAIGGIVGPGTTVIGHPVVWANTNGTLVADSLALFNGVTATTQAFGDSTTKVANDAFVQNAVNSGSGFTLEYYGGGSGVADNIAALTAFYAANPNGGRLNLGCNTYTFLSGLSHSQTATGVYTFTGCGSDLTKLSWPNGSGGLTIHYNNPNSATHWKGISILTSQAGGGTAITLIQDQSVVVNPAISAQTTFEDVVIRGADGYDLVDYWNIGIQVNSVSNIDFIGLLVTAVYPSGQGVVLSASVNAFGVAYNFTNCIFLDMSIGINYGGSGGYIQGVTVSQSNFTGVDFGIANGPGLVGFGELLVANSQFTTYAGAAIYEASAIEFTSLTNNLILAGQNNSTLITFLNNGEFTIIGNSLSAGALTGVNGIFIAESTGGAGIISLNTFSALSIGYNLAALSVNILTNANTFTGAGTSWVNSANNSVNTISEPASKFTFTPTFNFTGGTTPTATSTSGTWRQNGNLVYIEVAGTINYAGVPTAISFTLPNSFVSSRLQAVTGWNASTGLVVAEAAAGATTISFLNASAAIPVNSTGQVLSISGWFRIQ